MKLLSATDLAIAMAIRNDSLKVVECLSERLGEPYWSIEDANGVIEVALSASEVDQRVSAIKEAL